MLLQRSIDLVLTGLILVFFAPLLALVAVVILLLDDGPIFYARHRIGVGGREFQALSFAAC